MVWFGLVLDETRDEAKLLIFLEVVGKMKLNLVLSSKLKLIFWIYSLFSFWFLNYSEVV